MNEKNEQIYFVFAETFLKAVLYFKRKPKSFYSHIRLDFFHRHTALNIGLTSEAY